MESSEKILSSNIKKRRKALKLSQKKLAALAKISEQTLNRIEKMKQNPEDFTLGQIATVLGCTKEDLRGIGVTQAAPPPTPGAAELAEILTDALKRNRELEVKAQRRDEEREHFAKLASENKRLRSHIKVRKQQINELKAQLAAKKDEKVVESDDMPTTVNYPELSRVLNYPKLLEHIVELIRDHEEAQGLIPQPKRQSQE